MAKKVVQEIKLQIPAGKATPSPPVGPALGQAGVNIPMFCKEFNARTQPQAADGFTIPVVIRVHSDRTFSFVTRTPPAADLLRKEAGVDKGSGEPNKNKVGAISRDQLRTVAETKMADLNTDNVEMAMRIIEGTARSMGIDVR